MTWLLASAEFMIIQLRHALTRFNTSRLCGGYAIEPYQHQTDKRRSDYYTNMWPSSLARSQPHSVQPYHGIYPDVLEHDLHLLFVSLGLAWLNLAQLGVVAGDRPQCQDDLRIRVAENRRWNPNGKGKCA
ncbi:hypothetical protein F5Y09DRAFT_271620 [Xylaria sp. FL1042]|nr:hypothetical protein F5Y09DRAFT_271620 [Xylaria sp. FL1042]